MQSYVEHLHDAHEQWLGADGQAYRNGHRPFNRECDLLVIDVDEDIENMDAWYKHVAERMERMRENASM